MTGSYRGKRVLDVTLGGLALLLASPLVALCALLIRVDSPGPAFYVSDRVGRDERTFRMVKLRSMRVGADRAGWFTSPNDARVTRVGRFVRRTSIDELPNLINVLRGQMSLVGPRPASIPQLAQFTPRVRVIRSAARPGLTGLAQVCGRSELSLAESIDLDLAYVERCSLGLDLRILVSTVRTVLSARGTN